MTVKELKDLIKEFDGAAIVVMAKDGEGNNYSPLAEACDGLYLAENTWSGEVYSPDDAFEGGVPAMVLYPVS